MAFTHTNTDRGKVRNIIKADDNLGSLSRGVMKDKNNIICSYKLILGCLVSPPNYSADGEKKKKKKKRGNVI